MRLINWILRTPARIELSRRFDQYSGNEDDWEYRHTKYSPYFFGYNSEKDMGVYLEGNSEIKLNQFNEIDEWLDSSKYVNQENANPWPHPLVIDQTRSGNCIGLSLWA